MNGQNVQEIDILNIAKLRKQKRPNNKIMLNGKVMTGQSSWKLHRKN